ncbi:MAG: Fic family protein [Pseudomonadota bacterium]
MILFEVCGAREDHPAYESMAAANLSRQYQFLRSAVMAALQTERLFLAQSVIRALNYHAIACLHTNAGEYRPCKVTVGSGEDVFEPPEHFRVQALIDDFVNDVNRNWDKWDDVSLASYVLWKLNWIHPFINGNGRTARVTAYYIICLKAGGWLPGTTILPELIRANRSDYVKALKAADKSAGAGKLDLSELHELLSTLLSEQLATAAD